MISPEKIKLVTKALAAFLNVPFARAEDGGDRPRHIFLSYKTINQENEPRQRQIDTYTPIEGDGAKITHRTERRSALTVSYTIIGPSAEYYAIWEVANGAVKWFESEAAEGALLKQNMGAVVEEIAPRPGPYGVPGNGRLRRRARF
jgi:hypothetical protein